MDSPNEETRALRLLLIEDNASDALLLRRMLGKSPQPYDVTHCRSMAAAAECVGREWDMVLLDLFLPDSAGLETFQRCQAAWPDAALVVLSGLTDETIARQAVEAGAQDYLAKGSTDARALCRALQYAIGRHRASLERRALVKELEQSRRLEAIGQLAAGVAHEINTPTQYVSDNTRFLRDAVGELVEVLRGLRRCAEADAPPTLAELRALLAGVDVDFLLEELSRSVDQSLEGLAHIARIVRAMKEFTHPAGDEKEPTDLNRTLQTTVLVASNEWKYVATIETDLAPDLPPVECLSGEVNQVFLNLLVNAAHAVGDTLRDDPARKGRIAISTRAADGWVEVRIQDSGSGIRPEHRAKIFEPFFTTKGVGKGTGQGLAIARNVVVSKHGGTLDFESEIGRGTTFIVRLPLAAPAGEEKRNAA